MRSYWLAAAVIAGIAGATPAMAQRVWQDGRWVVMPRHGAPTVMRTDRHRWAMRDGRWDAGYRAPGGWKAYRRLHRGATLPGYWMGADFRVPDYLGFGLAAPPHGYSWVRYYDDAVLVDRDGRVWDSIDGIAWGGAVATASANGGHAVADSRVAGAGYPPPRIEPVDPDDYYYDDAAPIYDEREPYRGPYPGGEPEPLLPPPPPPVVRYGQAYQGGTWYGTYPPGTTVIIIPGAVTKTVVTEYVMRSYPSRPAKRIRRR